MLLHFVCRIADDLDRVEVFLFATRLTRITRHLATGSVDEVVPHIPAHVPDFSGGTRIGETLGVFNRRWARRVLGHGAVVLLISDGWDRGDPRMLGAEIARLQRTAHRLIWLNPLLGSPDYAPLTRGMQAALKFVDDFLPVHNLVSLQSAGGAPEQPTRAATRPRATHAGARTLVNLSATYTFDAPRQAVWDLLIDPTVVADCMPGCETFEPSGEDTYRATLTVGVGAITGRYEGTVAIVDKQAPSSYRLIVDWHRPGRVCQGRGRDRVDRPAGSDPRRRCRTRPGGWHRRPGWTTTAGECLETHDGPVLRVPQEEG